MTAFRRGAIVASLAAIFILSGASTALAAFGAVGVSRVDLANQQYLADVSGDRIAFTEQGSTGDRTGLYIYDIKSKTKTRVQTSANDEAATISHPSTYSPVDIDGDSVIWLTEDDDGEHLWFMPDLASDDGPEGIVHTGDVFDSIGVSGDRVVYSLEGNVGYHDAATNSGRIGIGQATMAEVSRWGASISGSTIVYAEEIESTGALSIWKYDITDSSATKVADVAKGYFPVTTATDGTWAAWQREDASGNTVVFYKNLKTGASASRAVAGPIVSLTLDSGTIGWLETGRDRTARPKVDLLHAPTGRFYSSSADAVNVSISGTRIIWTNMEDIFLGRLDTSTPTFTRYYGPSRYDTAIELSKTSHSTGATTVVLATGVGYADALSAAPLASAYDAPMLLTRQASLGTTLTAELKRLAPKQVFIAGGAAVVADVVKAELESLPSSPTVTRVSGSSRYSTSAAIARKVKDKLGKTTKVVVCNGENWSDALAVAPVAATNGWPILLTKAGSVPPAISSAMSYLKPTSTLVVGTTASVSNTVKSSFVSSSRIYGTSGPATSVAVAKWAAANGGVKPVRIGLATSAKYPDALAAGPFLALKRMDAGLILLVPPTGLPTVTSDYLKANRFAVKKVNVMGGPSVMPDSVVNSVKSIVR